MSDVRRGVAIRLHGPLQAWGGAVIGDNRPTLGFPTRSGVLGLAAACLGIARTEVATLLELARDARVHVRVDAPGKPLVDDQTIQDNPNASPTRQTIQSKRTYLCDASFVAVLVPGPAIEPDAIVRAFQFPKFAPFLGRRSCAPSTPLLISEVSSRGDAIDFFETIERGPAEILTKRAPASFDFYLDVPDHPRALRRLPVRDHFAGPLPRQWRERFAVHVRATSDPSASDRS